MIVSYTVHINLTFCFKHALFDMVLQLISMETEAMFTLPLISLLISDVIYFSEETVLVSHVLLVISVWVCVNGNELDWGEQPRGHKPSYTVKHH